MWTWSCMENSPPGARSATSTAAGPAHPTPMWRHGPTSAPSSRCSKPFWAVDAGLAGGAQALGQPGQAELLQAGHLGVLRAVAQGQQEQVERQQVGGAQA